MESLNGLADRRAERLKDRRTNPRTKPRKDHVKWFSKLTLKEMEAIRAAWKQHSRKALQEPPEGVRSASR